MIKKLIVYCLIVFALVSTLEFLSFCPKTKEFAAKLTRSEDYIDSGSGAASVQPYIDGVRSQDGTTKLILGDSIANQLFSGYKMPEDYSVKTSFAAIGITGQYMLAHEYLENHTDATDIYIMVHPETLMRTFDTDYGYSYGVLPYALNDCMQILDDWTFKRMRPVYGRFFMTEMGARFVEESSLNRKMYQSFLLVHKKPYEQKNAYEIAEHTLTVLQNECDAHGVKLHLIPSPSSEFYRESIEGGIADWNDSTLNLMFPDYMSSIYYFPTEQTLDNTHFAGEYAERGHLDRVLKVIFNYTLQCIK